MDSKDGTAAKAGNLQATPGQTPTPAPGTSGSAEKTYTETELQKAISDAKAAAGRVTAGVQKQLDGIKAQYDTLARQVEERELDSVRSDPAKLTAYQSRKALDARVRDLDTREATLNEREATLNEREVSLTEREAAVKKLDAAAAVKRLASEHGIEESRLASLGIEDAGTLERVAVAMSGKAPAPKPQPVGRVDSAKSRGGSSLEGMSPEQKIAKGLDDMRRKGG